MSAGYVIYSLDWEKFRKLVERPTERQLKSLAKLLRDGLSEQGDEFEGGDPMLHWPTDVRSLAQIVGKRLALPDWYGDLSAPGKSLWEGVVVNACMNRAEIDVGFRVDNDGIYWDVIEIAWKHHGVVPRTITTVALSTFGTRPFRYHQGHKATKSRRGKRDEDASKAAGAVLRKAIDQFKTGPQKPPKETKTTQKNKPALGALQDVFKQLQDPDRLSRKFNDELSLFFNTPAFAALEKIAKKSCEDGDDSEDWLPMHSMHTPDEVQSMWSELQSVRPAIKSTRDKRVRKVFEEELMPAMESVVRDGRILFIQVDG